jgi:hypothetical protein
MNFSNYTKAELIQKLTKTRATNDELEGRLNEGLKGQELRDNRVEHVQRELGESRRMFMELYKEKRTLGLRFGWLEDAATEAVNACEKHADENLDRLRDELGLEMTGD